MSDREIKVSENEYHHSKYSGHTVRIELAHNRHQRSALSLSRSEAESLADLLDHYLTENPA